MLQRLKNLTLQAQQCIVPLYEISKIGKPTDEREQGGGAGTEPRLLMGPGFRFKDVLEQERKSQWRCCTGPPDTEGRRASSPSLPATWPLQEAKGGPAGKDQQLGVTKELGNFPSLIPHSGKFQALCDQNNLPYPGPGPGPTYDGGAPPNLSKRDCNLTHRTPNTPNSQRPPLYVNRGPSCTWNQTEPRL